MQLKKCYAEALGGCSSSLSREHYISKGLIDLGQHDPNEILLGGLLDIGTPTSSRNLAVSKILCEKHNNDLSVLDTEAIRLCRTLFQWNQLNSKMEEEFDGDLLMRWQCKSLLGLYVVKMGDREFIKNLTFEALCKWAFGLDTPPKNIGISVPNGILTFPREAMVNGGYPPWVISSLSDAFGRIAGYKTWFYPMEFTLDLRGHTNFSQETRFKPNLLTFVSTQRSSELKLNLTWNDFDGGVVNFQLD